MTRKPPLDGAAPAGTLFVVATPIGNMADISQRALQVLQDVDRIAAEDTRTTGKLLARYGIKTPMLRHEKHNEGPSAEGLVKLMVEGAQVALVSDAGTPAISDPGARLVRAARKAGLAIVTIPGPSALTAAFSISGFGLPLTFHGFLPKKREARRAILEGLGTGTHAFYCPGRDLDVVLGELGDAHVFVAREMTKIYEQSLVGEAAKVAQSLVDLGALKGEAVVLVDVPDLRKDVDDETVRSDLRALLKSGSSTRDATAQIAQALDLPRRRVYRLALEVAKDE